MKILIITTLALMIASCGTSFDIRNSYDIFMSSCKAQGFDADRCQRDWVVRPLKNIQGNVSSGLSFMCKNAIGRGDQGAIFVHCN